MSKLSTFLACILCLAPLLMGCGSGTAGSPSGDPDPDPDPGPTTAEQAQVVLDACLVSAFNATVQHVKIYITIINDQSVADGIMIAPGSETASPQFFAQWSRDPAMTMMPTQIGDMSTEDAMGDPAEPFTDMQLDPLRMNGISELAALLGMLDGVVFVVSSSNVQQMPATQGSCRALFTMGAAGPLSGAYQASENACAVTVTFSDIAAANFNGTHPTGTFDIEVVMGMDTLTGTVTANGTSSASGTFSLNGVAAGNFGVDLASGAVTIAP